MVETVEYPHTPAERFEFGTPLHGGACHVDVDVAPLLAVRPVEGREAAYDEGR
jgi:hypothetical protein